ncbi:3-methyl-2-oxobutanoate hydroxymethyltransferase, partial [candidate division TA06 bacterium]
KNAQLFIDAGADGVKIEGNHYEIIKKLVKNSINVMGHIGLLPQSYKTYKVVGREEEEKISLINDAISIEKAGAFSVVLESMPENLGGKITNAVQIPTIGIGAGRYCDGQVLVINDLLGMDPDFHPKFVKRYLNLYQLISNSVNSFIKDVKEGNYPDSEHIYE